MTRRSLAARDAGDAAGVGRFRDRGRERRMTWTSAKLGKYEIRGASSGAARWASVYEERLRPA